MFAAMLLAVTNQISGQSLPKDVTKSVDTFTGDTIYKTKYGRLDNPQGCGRSDIAIEWLLVSGKRGKSERVAYQWGMIDAPFSPKATWLNGVGAVLNIDGEFIDTETPLLEPKLRGGGREFHETGWFRLQRGTLKRIAESNDAKLRVAGTEKTCDGTIEQNMVTRIRWLLEYADGVRLEAAPKATVTPQEGPRATTITSTHLLVSIGGSTLDVLPANKQVAVLSQEGEWTKVSVGGLRGYVKTSQLKFEE